jgi:type I restriction enzyme M protein
MTTQVFSAFEETSATKVIVSKLWSMCNILRDDGITYQHYVTELTYLLFLKMLAETGRENLLPANYRWSELDKREGEEQLFHYKKMLLDLGAASNPKVTSLRVKAIFADAQTSLRKPTNLKSLTDAIDRLDWFSAREEGLGNLYEGLLEKNAAEKKSGAGQYFTPRPLIDCIVNLLQPKPGEVIQDPAAGTGGFLVASDHYIKAGTDDLFKLTEAQQQFQRNQAFVGLELVPDTHKLCLMNMMLHGIEGGVDCGDTLSPDGQTLPKADLVLTNPPFGTKRGGGGPTRNDFSVTAGTSNKQLAFVEHIYRALKPGGRAAVVVPDNVLYEDNTGKKLRKQLMDCCNLHTILRLPHGIFYAQSVNTNVLFFNRGTTDRKNTESVWIYDMRTNMSMFGKTSPLTRQDFKDFEEAFGTDPLCKSKSLAKRVDGGPEGRFRNFSREFISNRQDNLDISWLKSDENEDSASLPSPEVLARTLLDDLECALTEIRDILLELGEEDIDE